MSAFKKLSLTLTVLALAGMTRADEKSAIAKIESLSGRVLYIAKDSKEYSVTIIKNLFENKKGFTASDAKALGELKNAVEVAFQHSDASDDWVAPLKGLTGLKKIHLEKTKITDKALDTIAGLANLEYLNVYGTAVTDAGLDKLKNLKKLKSLYLWQTKVTEAKAKGVSGSDGQGRQQGSCDQPWSRQGLAQRKHRGPTTEAAGGIGKERQGGYRQGCQGGVGTLRGD